MLSAVSRSSKKLSSLVYSLYGSSPEKCMFSGRSDTRHACPPPIPLQQSKQNLPTSSHYTSLKRTHSNTAVGKAKPPPASGLESAVPETAENKVGERTSSSRVSSEFNS